jgi:predicted lactoylglutathione lyase
MREREGNMRLGRAKGWADKALSKIFHHWEHEKATPEGREKARKMERAYKTWIWLQTAYRNPNIIAENVYDSATGIFDAKINSVTVRTNILKDANVLGIDVISQIATEANPTVKQRAVMERVSILDRDIALVQHAAMYGGESEAPREIRDTDFDLIKGQREWKHDGVTEVISEDMRRSQAKRYVQLLHEKMFKDSSLEQWRNRLGIEHVDGNLVIKNFEQIDTLLLENKNKGGRLTAEAIDKDRAYFMGTEDAQFRYFDVEALGERHNARLANDLESRAKAIMLAMKIWDMAKPKLDEKKYFETVQELYITEKDGRGPASADKLTKVVVRPMAEFYRQYVMSELPIIGKILSKYNEWSMSKVVFGPEAGDAWSINNMREHIHHLQQATGMPHHRLNHDGEEELLSVEGLENELAGTKSLAIAEMVFIGSFLVMGLTGFAAYSQSKKDNDAEDGH